MTKLITFFRHIAQISQEKSSFTSKTLIIISHIQIVSIYFFLFSLLGPKTSNFQTFLLSISNLLTGINTHFESIDTIHIIIIIITIILHLIVLVVLVLEVYFIRNLRAVNKRFYLSFEKLLVIIYYFAGLPMFNVVLRFMKHEVGEGEAKDILNAALGIFLIILNILISSQIFINFPLKTKNQLSAQGNQYLACTTVQRYLYSLLLVVSDENKLLSQVAGWIICLLGLIVTVIGLYYLLAKSGYYYISTQRIALGIQSFVLTMSLVMIILKASDSITTFQDFVIIVIVVYIPIGKMVTCQDFEIQLEKISIFLNGKNSELINPKNLFSIYEYAQRRAGISPDDWQIGMNNFKSLVFEKLVTASCKESDGCLTKKLLGHLESMSEKFTSINDRLAFSYMNHLLKSDFKAYSMITSLLNIQNLPFNIKLGAHWIIDQIAIKYKMTNDSKMADSALVEYFNCLKKQEDIMSSMKECLEEYKKFYLTLNEHHPCLYKVSKISSNLQTMLNKIQAKWNELSQEIIENSPQFIADYALFIFAIKTEKERGAKLIKLHSQILLKKKNSKKNRVSKSQITPSECVFIELSMEKFNHGTIINGNFKNIRMQLGYNSQELVGKNMTILFPNFLKDKFFNKIKDFAENYGLQSKDSDACLILHKEGYACTYNCTLMIHPILDSQIKVLCKFTPDKLKKDVVIITGKKLEAATRNIFYEMREKSMGTSHSAELEIENMGYVLEPLKKNCKIIDHKSTVSEESTFDILDACNQNDCLNARSYFVSRDEPKVKTIIMKKYEDEEKDHEEDYDENLDEHEEISKKIAPKLSSKFSSKLIQKTETHLSLVSEYLDESLSDKMQGNLRSMMEALPKTKKSVASGDSEIPCTNIKRNFENLLPKLSLFKFQEKYLLFGSFALLLISMAVTLFISYSNATYSFEQVDVTINLIKNLYGRSASITDVSRTSYVYAFANLYYPPGPQANSVLIPTSGAALARVKAFSDYNRNVRKYINDLDDAELKKFFYEKNVRVYHDEFDSILNSSAYSMNDNFEAAAILISAAQTFGKQFKTNSSEMINQAKFIMILSMNDLFLVCKSQPAFVQNALNNILTNINNMTLGAFIFSAVSLGVYLITVIYVFSSHYKVSREFLVSIINVNPDFINEIIIELSEFERKILGLPPINNFSLLSAKLSSKEAKKKAEKRLGIKSGNTKFLFMHFFLNKTTCMILMVVPTSVLLWISYSYPTDTYKIINKNLEDLKALNEIGVGVAEIITDSNYFDYVSFSFTHNSEPGPIYEKDIQSLDYLISAERAFSPEVLNYLNKDICVYFIKTALVESCYKIISGQAQKGISSVIYFLKTFYASMKVYSETITDPAVRARITSSIPMKIEASVVGLNAVIPAVRVFSEEITDSLTMDLEGRISNLIMLFGFSVTLDAIVLLAAFVWIKKNVIKGRSIIANTLKIVPLEFVGANKNLRFYLIKESKEFLKVTKEIIAMVNRN